MRLILLRHAKAEKAEPGEEDRQRRLNERGRDDARTIGAYLARHQLIPDLILASPALRTRETAERIVRELPSAPPATYEARLYNAGAQMLVSVMRETKSAVGTLLVVGHNPGLHELARLLIASGDVEARELLAEALPTAGLVVIDFAGKDWRKLHPHGGRLERFVTPRSLVRSS